MLFRQIFEPKLAQYSYLIGCHRTGEAIVIDPMRDIKQCYELAAKENLHIVAAADTHIHADYVSGLREFAERGVKVFTSDEGAPDWRYEWLVDSKYPYQLLKHNDTFNVGTTGIRAVHTPGHTPEHLSYLITDQCGGVDEPMGMMTGDFIFVGDVGRPDLLETAAGFENVMESSARMLYRSILEFKKLPDFYRVWPGHGSGSACGKSLGAAPYTTVGNELRSNPAIQHARTEEEFVRYILDGQPEPPYYFARMKRINRAGPKLLGKLPEPKRITATDLLKISNENNVAILDTRAQDEFLKAHIQGSLFCPWNKTFNTIAGCYVEENKPIVLIIEEDRVREAVRDLVNVGLDTITGFAPPSVLKQYETVGGKLEHIDQTSFEALGEKLLGNDVNVLDVRSSSEFAGLRLPNAQNIAHTRLLARINEIPNGRKLFIHCETGSRSAVAAAFLKSRGYDVAYVGGNFTNWMKRRKVTAGNI